MNDVQPKDWEDIADVERGIRFEIGWDSETPKNKNIVLKIYCYHDRHRSRANKTQRKIFWPLNSFFLLTSTPACFLAYTAKIKPMAASSKKKQVFDTGKDRDVITARSGAKAMGHKCGNPQCYVRALEVPLKACAKCKTIRSVAVAFMEIH